MATVKQLAVLLKKKKEKAAKLHKELKLETSSLVKLQKELAAAKKKEAGIRVKSGEAGKTKVKVKSAPVVKVQPEVKPVTKPENCGDALPGVMPGASDDEI